MIPRRTWLAAFFVAVAGWSADPPPVEFVQMSDAHVAKFDTAHPAFAKDLAPKKDAVARASKALETLGRDVAPAFILFTGDLADAYGYEGANGRMVYGQLEVFQSIFERSPIPIYPVLGNHDITQYHYAADKPKPVSDQSLAAEARREWRRLLPNFREGTYYTFHKMAGPTDYLFLVLDDGDGPGNNAEYVATELAWIKAQIAAHPHAAIILAMHIPLAQADFWSGLKPVLASASNVVLSIAGHRHSDGMEEMDLGTRKLTQVRTAAVFMGEGNWRKFRLRRDGIDIFATGQADRLEKTVEVKQAAAAGAAQY